LFSSFVLEINSDLDFHDIHKQRAVGLSKTQKRKIGFTFVQTQTGLVTVKIQFAASWGVKVSTAPLSFVQ